MEGWSDGGVEGSTSNQQLNSGASGLVSHCGKTSLRAAASPLPKEMEGTVTVTRSEGFRRGYRLFADCQNVAADRKPEEESTADEGPRSRTPLQPRRPAPRMGSV